MCPFPTGDGLSAMTGEKTADDHDLRLRWPFAMLLAGSSGCGKTTLLGRFLANANRTMRRTPKRIVIYCAYDQPAYRQLKEQAPCPVIIRREELPSDLETDPGTLLVIDDLQGSHAEALTRWFTVKRHHLDTAVIYVVQNVFDKTPQHRTISLNSTHIVLFKNPRDSSQVTHLAKQVFPQDPSFVARAYASFTRGRPHSYLVMDFHQNTPDMYRLRDSLLPYDDFPSHVFADASSEDVYLRQLADDALQRVSAP